MRLRNENCLVILSILGLTIGARAVAIDLKPISSPYEIKPSQPTERESSDAINLLPISDPGILTHGRSLKRGTQGLEAFDPTSSNSFFWGAYAGDTIYTANFTLHNEDPDEFILPVENFAKNLKSINCGTSSTPMTIEFNDKDAFDYAKAAWDWVNQEDDNKFTVVTKPNQCFEGDDRTPYLVYDIAFDATKLLAKLSAQERPWGEIAHTFRLTLSHETLNPDTVNVTHPHLMPRSTKTMDLTHDFNQNLFHLGSAETNGLELSADAQIHTRGQLIADLDVDYKWFIPTDVKINMHPSGIHGDLLLSLTADGKLGRPIDWAMKPEIEIPVSALNIKGILQIGPFVTMGVHFGSTAIEGHAQATVGARAILDDTAVVEVKLRHPDENKISGWTPHFEKIDPTFTASISASMKAWAELGITLKAEVLGKWGYQASVDAQLPYFEAAIAGKVDTNGGICGTTKTMGVDFNTNVGIDVNLNAGEIDKAPTFSKDLYQTAWPLFSTCVAFGPDAAASSSAPSTAPLPATSVEPTSVATIASSPDLSSISSSAIETGASSVSANATGSPITSALNTPTILTSVVESDSQSSTQIIYPSFQSLLPSSSEASEVTLVSSSAAFGSSSSAPTDRSTSIKAATSSSANGTSSAMQSSSLASSSRVETVLTKSDSSSSTASSSAVSASPTAPFSGSSTKSTGSPLSSSSTSCTSSKTASQPTTTLASSSTKATSSSVTLKISSAGGSSSSRPTSGTATSRPTISSAPSSTKTPTSSSSVRSSSPGASSKSNQSKSATSTTIKATTSRAPSSTKTFVSSAATKSSKPGAPSQTKQTKGPSKTTMSKKVKGTHAAAL